MGDHRATRKNAGKMWLVPAVGTAMAVSGQTLVAAGTADASLGSSPATSASNITIAPQWKPGDPGLTALAQRLRETREQPLSLTAGMRENGYVLYVQKKLGVLPRTAQIGQTTGAGNFGPRTRQAVLRFQLAQGLPVTGRVGPKTWDALRAGPAGKVHTTVKAKAAKTPAATRASRSSSRAPLRSALSGSRVDRILQLAASQQGTPYVWGGTTPSGFDCSGYVGWVYRQVGVSLPRTSRQIFNAVDRIPKAAARAGDLFFVRGSGGTIYHVGIVGRNGVWWEARNSRNDVGKFAPWADGSDVIYARV